MISFTLLEYLMTQTAKKKKENCTYTPKLDGEIIRHSKLASFGLSHLDIDHEAVQNEWELPDGTNLKV